MSTLARQQEQPALRNGAQAGRIEQQPSSAPGDLSQNKWAVSLAVIFGVLMSAIDTSVVNVALPNIQGNLGATQQEITWISTSYMISVVILMPLTNWLSVRFGRKRVYLTSLVVFTAASFMCGTSRSLGELILWRAIQGFGAGTLQPLAQAMFREAFPQKQQGLAMGIFGFVVLAGPAVGPTLGGWITDNYNWPWIFFINIPIGIVGAIVAWRVLRDPANEDGHIHPPVDGIGILLLAVGLSCAQTVLEQGETDDWFTSPFIVWFTLISVVTLVGFIWWELTHDKPAVDLRVLKNVQFTAGTVVGGILGIGLFASLFLLPQFMQLLLGFTATQAGISLMPRSLAMMVMMPISGALYNRLGPRVMIIVGLVLAFWTQLIMSHFTAQTGAQDIVMPLVVQGIGFGMIFVALSTVTLATMQRSKMTSATGLYNLIRQLGGSIGTAVVVTLLTKHMAYARAELVTNARATNPAFLQSLHGAAAGFIAHGYSTAAAQTAALASIYGMVEKQAVTIAYEYIFLWIGILFALCIPLALLLSGGPPQSGKAEIQHAGE